MPAMNDVGGQQRGVKREDCLPPFSRWLFCWFMWYVRGFLTRSFHAVRLLEGQRTIDVLITDTRLTALLTG